MREPRGSIGSATVMALSGGVATAGCALLVTER